MEPCGGVRVSVGVGVVPCGGVRVCVRGVGGAVWRCECVSVRMGGGGAVWGCECVHGAVWGCESECGW